MEYDQVLAAIHSRRTFSSSASLERITRLMDRLGNPQDQIRCIHVAGTNGKGSVCALVESALRQSGYRVGLFTSPYLVDFRERIQIDRRMISQEQLVACYETVMEAEERLEQEGLEPVNEFELVTALGFVAFQRAEVDYAVIEVGLGGRCDATNVIKSPEVCCITSISLDHVDVLGHTVGEIAGEKAGIIKPGRPVVMARQAPEAEAVIRQRAEELGSPLVETGRWRLLEESLICQRIGDGSRELLLQLLGRFQADNAGAAWEVCRLLGLEELAVRQGFFHASWPGRLQYVPGSPEMLIDAGHNPAGITALCQVLDCFFLGQNVIGVMAMMGDKAHQECVPMVARRCHTLIAATVGLPRSLTPEQLAREAAPYCPVRTANSVAEGIQLARALASPEDLILVAGSVYAAGEALRTI